MLFVAFIFIMFLAIWNEEAQGRLIATAFLVFFSALGVIVSGAVYEDFFKDKK